MKNGATEQHGIEVYAFKMFWIRLANIQYSLDNFDEYQKHFTVHPLLHSFSFSPYYQISCVTYDLYVMNYTGFALTQLRYNDFITNFEQQYPFFIFIFILFLINKKII